MIKAIIFDWHGVLDFVTFAGFVEKISEISGRSQESAEQILADYKTKVSLGARPESIWSEEKRALNLSDEEFDSAKNYMLSIERNKDLWAILPTLAQKYALAILSDIGLDKTKKIRESMDLNLFKQIYFSAERRISKNDDNLFLSIAFDLGLPPQECLYVDDQVGPITKARNLGFRVLQFQGNDEFLRKLPSL